jgi:Kef-type K+ transport system membrane component KefB
LLKILAGVGLLLAVAFIGYRRSFTRLRLPMGVRLVFLTGTEYILVGVALGGGFIGLLDETTVRSLSPLFGLGLGLIGLILGIQAEVKMLRRFPPAYLRITVIQAVVAMLFVFGPCYFVLAAMSDLRNEAILLGTLVLTSTAACTAQSPLALIDREFRPRNARVLVLLRYVSSLDGLVGLLLFGFAMCVVSSRFSSGVDLLAGVHWFGVSIVIGVVMGFLLHLLTRLRCGDEELLVFVLGMVLFTAGVAFCLELSALFMCMTMGVVATNLPGSKARIHNLLAGLEKPFYIVFLILAGAVWHLGSPWALPLAGLYLVLRLAGKVVGGWLAVKAARSEDGLPPALGLGLVSQGGVVIAMVMSIYQASTSVVADIVVTAVVLSVVVSEFVGPSLAVFLLRREGEIET